MITAIIPARGGSKGVPGKNVLQLVGKPLVAWTIDHAREAEQVDSVIVATDNDEIASVAEEYGAGVHRRHEATATDHASTESVLFDVLARTPGPLPELVVLLQPTSPIRQPHDIDSAIRRLRETNADSLFSGRYVEGYIWQQRLDGRCKGTAIEPQHKTRNRRQDDDNATIEENGSIYVFKPSVLFAHNNRLGGVVTFYEMSPLDSFQLDSIDDVEVLDHLIRCRCDS